MLGKRPISDFAEYDPSILRRIQTFTIEQRFARNWEGVRLLRGLWQIGVLHPRLIPGRS